MAHVPKNPAIAMRDGVSPNCVALPRMKAPPWQNLLDSPGRRLAAVSREEWQQRMEAGEVVGEDGQPLDASHPYQNGARRLLAQPARQAGSLPRIDRLPGRHLVVADKPAFPARDAGRIYVQQTLLVRLKEGARPAEPWSPLHRIDRDRGPGGVQRAAAGPRRLPAPVPRAPIAKTTRRSRRPATICPGRDAAQAISSSRRMPSQ